MAEPIKPKKKFVLNLKIAKKPVDGCFRIGQQGLRKAYPSHERYIQIPAWSRGKGDFKELSPFFLGPIIESTPIDSGTDVSSDLVAKNLENYWQRKKVYRCHVDAHNNPSPLWYAWRNKGFQDDKADRHPMGKEKPLYMYHNGQCLNTVEGRLAVYIPTYKELARKTGSYKRLLMMLKNGTNILIIEPDGPQLHRFPNGLEVNAQLLDEMKYITDVNTLYNKLGLPLEAVNKYFPYGHGYVLAEALLEDLNNLN